MKQNYLNRRNIGALELSAAEVTLRLGISEERLDNWFQDSEGPPPIPSSIGHARKYLEADVQEWERINGFLQTFHSAF